MSARFVRAAQDLERRWAAIYTAGLPDEARKRRRAEIDSDLYEHQQDALTTTGATTALAADVFGRFLLGLPADVSWRLGLLRTSGRASVAPVAAVSFALFVAAISVAFAVSHGLQGGTGDLVLNMIAISGVAAFLLGFARSKRSPLLGGSLAVAGSLFMSFSLFWTLIEPLLGLALAAYAVRRAWGFAKDRPQQPPFSGA